MADALVSPAVGGTMWAVSAGLVGYCSAQAKKQLDDRIAPLMGVLGAFVFAVQMINFTIPATGSSGHFGGGLLLAILLGPWAGLLTISSILIVQALFFADGGILALGCNIFNIGFFPCLIAYPLIYKPITTGTLSRIRIFTGAIVASLIALQMGALGVVLETTISGITELPLLTFALFMQPIHLGIGLVEGLITASIILFLYTARPELLQTTTPRPPVPQTSILPVLKTFALAAVITGGVISWFASTHPDGLEWSIFQTSKAEELGHKQSDLHKSMAALQNHSVILPDYDFANHASNESAPVSIPKPQNNRIGTTTSGLLGTGIFLLFTVVISFLFKLRRAKP